MSISSNATGLKPGVCTSTTRPTNPYLGQLIFQTDTGTMHNWDGATWQFLAPTQQRNILYNGAMQVAQRGTSTPSITANGYYTADRWQVGLITLGTWTQSVENDAPTGSGFRKSLKMLCTTADASPVSTDVCAVQQVLEGQDLQAFRKGTSSAQQFTVSFWVKANVTGTYILFLQDYDNNRSVSKTYTVSSSATWEFKTLTFPADTTGALDNDNALSFGVRWVLAAGPSWTSGTRNETWDSITLANLAQGQTVNLASATNNYWQITGVQLNVGGVAAPFEFKSYGQELAECQRYYQRHDLGGSYFMIAAPVGSGNGLIQYSLPVPMRAAPTFTASSGSCLRPLTTGGSSVGTTNTTSVGWYSTANQYGGQIYFSGSSGLTAGAAVGVYINSGAYFEFTGAEL